MPIFTRYIAYLVISLTQNISYNSEFRVDDDRHIVNSIILIYSMYTDEVGFVLL